MDSGSLAVYMHGMKFQISGRLNMLRMVKCSHFELSQFSDFQTRIIGLRTKVNKALNITGPS